jgi:hypothetical protein
MSEEGDEPMEGRQENPSKLPHDATENLTKEPAVDICTRGTTSFGDPLKKDPVENASQECLSRSLPEATEDVAKDDLANEPATEKSCSIATSSRKLLMKKDLAIEVTAEKPRFHVAN